MLVFGTVIATVAIFPIIFVGCNDIDINGLTLNPETNTYQVEQTCQSCNCPENQIQLVQDANNVLYSSPCAAGCLIEADRSNFTNCGCLLSNSADDTATSKITLCSKAKMWIILSLWALMSFTHGLIGGPYISLFIESLTHLTDQNVKVVAFGLMHFMTKIIGYAPGPFIAGKLIDSTCQFWKFDQARGIR